MKILQIIPTLRKGGAERLALNICHELAKRDGITIKLVTLHPQNDYQELTEGLDWTVIPATFIPSITGKAIWNV